ncbi:hypothetical protein [Mucilaginibacter sp. UR6-11]|uniref:hypothetical protein n=1 Tax=Mucilaginibacter sp. UR6-11 TaxID=1435644 RepID=UPI001E52C736|nr:hypothetical protein [Mucilaginibacter sp. UR6-11]MCC8425622.1 hypothetical protein [Mucilaginibacter sp. UR6-11]
MKKSLLTLIIYLCCTQVYGQHITLLNLINLTSLNNTQAGNTLTSGKTWGLQYGEDLNGFVVEHYQTSAPRNRIETIIIGTGIKTASGAILHTVSYVSPNPQDVINLTSQAKGAGLIQNFKGADKQDNIYIYESFLYHMVVRLAIDNSKGVIDVTQKQVFVE